MGDLRQRSYAEESRGASAQFNIDAARIVWMVLDEREALLVAALNARAA